MIYNINKLKSLRLEILKYLNLELIPDTNSKILKFVNADILENYIRTKKLLMESNNILNLKLSPGLVKAVYNSIPNVGDSIKSDEINYSELYNSNKIYTLSELFICNTKNRYIDCNNCRVDKIISDQRSSRISKEEYLYNNNIAHSDKDLPRVYTCEGVVEYYINSR